jgi:D-3-phosphoglycerate dehydrogenase
MMNKSKGDNAYTVVDITGDVHDDLSARLGAVEGVIKVRII